MLRIAFIRIGGHPWTGGKQYLLNLLGVLSDFASEQVWPVVFTGTDCPKEEIHELSSLGNVEVVRTKRFSAMPHRWELARSILLGNDRSAAKAFKKHRIDVVFEAAQFFGWRLRIPAVAWLSDFQHKSLPEMFPPLYRLRRSAGHRMQVWSGRTIMVSSEDARDTCLQLYPYAGDRLHCVRFAIRPQMPPSLSEALGVAQKYGLPRSFFFLPNQFWRHKNHLLVIEALAMLRNRGRHIVVAASGQHVDPISSGHFDNIKKKVAELDLQSNFRVLGLLPRQHIHALMRAATALLNPSLFEGWSTTVEEARSIGTPMVLSDLAVHREQMGSEATYFDRFSATALAECLDRFAVLDEQQREIALVKAQAQAKERAKEYAERFTRLMALASKRQPVDQL